MKKLLLFFLVFQFVQGGVSAHECTAFIDESSFSSTYDENVSIVAGKVLEKKGYHLVEELAQADFLLESLRVNDDNPFSFGIFLALSPRWYFKARTGEDFSEIVAKGRLPFRFVLDADWMRTFRLKGQLSSLIPDCQ